MQHLPNNVQSWFIPCFHGTFRWLSVLVSSILVLPPSHDAAWQLGTFCFLSVLGQLHLVTSGSWSGRLGFSRSTFVGEDQENQELLLVFAHGHWISGIYASTLLSPPGASGDNVKVWEMDLTFRH